LKTTSITRSIRWPLLIILVGSPHQSLLAQTPRTAPGKAPAATPTTTKEDPFAPLLLKATDAIDKNNFADALDPLQKYIAERPDEPYAHFQLGYAYSGLKRFPEAKSEFQRAITLDPKMAPAHLNLGLVLMDTEPAAAAQAFLRAADLLPTESRPRFLAGFALEHADKLPEAVEQYRGALALAPKDYEYQFAIGRALLRVEKPAEAEDHFQQAVAARGNSAPARLGLANSLLEQKEYSAAVDALAEYLKLTPDDRAARMDRAFALLELNRTDETLAELDRADGNSTPTAESLKMRGSILYNQEKWKEASEPLSKAIVISPLDPELFAWLGHAALELHDYANATKILGQAYALNHKSASVLHDLANAFFLKEDYGSALGAMDRLAAIETPLPLSWFIRAICYDKLEHKVEAIDAYQKFLDQDNGKNDSQELEARHRIPALQKELKTLPRSQKR
jgi:Flp pilus assembly protein TadD